jgi:RNA polymerase primary sigma factor
VPRRRLPAAIKRLPELEQEVFRQLYWEQCPDGQLATAVRKQGIACDDPEAVVSAAKRVREALPANFKTADEERRREVPLTKPDDPDGGPIELADERPTPEQETIARQDEETLEQACGALRGAIDRLPPDVRLYLNHVMAEEPAPAPRDIARLMGRPVTEVYALRQQAERLLRQILRENTAVKNLRMSV